jgi:hypothetical protein
MTDRVGTLRLVFEFHDRCPVDVVDVTRLLVDIESLYALAAVSAGLDPGDVVSAALRVAKDNHVVDNFVAYHPPPPTDDAETLDAETTAASLVAEPTVWALDHRRSAPRTNLRLKSLEFGSPFSVLVEVPWEAYLACGSGIVAAVGLVFGAPFRAGERLHDARNAYWHARLNADRAREDYIEWRSRTNRNRVRLVSADMLDEPDVPELEA